MDVFKEFLRRRRLPLTEQRAQVARVLFSTHKHVSVEDILERLRAERVVIGNGLPHAGPARREWPR